MKQDELTLLGPQHNNNNQSNRKKIILISLVLVTFFCILEFVGGFLSNSLALLSDASHMFTDVISLCLALFGIVVSKFKSNTSNTYGYSRIEIIFSLINSLFLVFISIFIIYESIHRFFNPTPVSAIVMLPIAISGLIVNFVVMYLFSRSEKNSSNTNQKSLLMKSAFLHFLSDTIGSIVAIVVSITIYYTNLYIIDPILSLIFVSLINYNAIKIIKSSIHILMESTPKNINPLSIKNSLENINGVANIHHIHLWMLNEMEYIITLHAICENNINHTSIIIDIKNKLLKEFSISHSTIQIENQESGCLN